MKINVDFIYPIGSVYISTESTNPSILFGGKWIQTCKSRALVGAGSNIANTDSNYGTYAAGTLNLQAGELLGEISHKLTVAEMPSHKHQIKTNNDDFNNSPNGGNYGTTHDGANSWYNTNWYTENSGGNGAHNNIMPIEVYYIWKRVS